MALDMENYVGVQERCAEFHQDFPEGSIRTFLVKSEGPEVVFEARVYRTLDEARAGIYTSGFAREVEGKSPVNKTSHLENCESSAVGRALANLGYPTKADVPRRSELLRRGRIEREHAALVDYIREVGLRVPDGLCAVLDGESVDLRAHVREQWGAIKASYPKARAVADVIEVETGVRRG